MSNNIDGITVNGIVVDAKKADKILGWLIRREAENVRTNDRTDVKMISDIQKRIKEEAECY